MARCTLIVLYNAFGVVYKNKGVPGQWRVRLLLLLGMDFPPSFCEIYYYFFIPFLAVFCFALYEGFFWLQHQAQVCLVAPCICAFS